MFNVKLDKLLCVRTDDLFFDECVMYVRVDQSNPLRIKLSPSKKLSWVSISKTFQFQNQLTIHLFEIDGPSDFDQDRLFLGSQGDDKLGKIVINPLDSCARQKAVFRTRRAHYELLYQSSPIFELTNSVGVGGGNRPEDVQSLKRKLISLGYHWLTNDEALNDETVYTIRLFQSIVNGRHTISGDGRVDVPGPTYSWLQACNAPQWQQMPAGSSDEGFINFELSDTTDNHDFGTNWMVDSIKDIGNKYHTDYLTSHPNAAFLTINDVSLPQGGNTPDHAGHETGLGCDIRLPQLDGSASGIIFDASNSNYDRQAMRAMLIAIKNTPLWSRTFFNDNVLITEGLCVHLDGHSNHAHFEIKPPTIATI